MKIFRWTLRKCLQGMRSQRSIALVGQVLKMAICFVAHIVSVMYLSHLTEVNPLWQAVTGGATSTGVLSKNAARR